MIQKFQCAQCGECCSHIRGMVSADEKEFLEKYAYGKFDVYRFSISKKSYGKLYEDILNLSKLFPTCNLAQKQDKLIKQIKFFKNYNQSPKLF